MTEQVCQYEDANGPVVLQDENTSEAIIYGPAYSWIKNVLWIWDEIEDYLRRKADSYDSQIIDREWCYYVWLHNPYLIEARSPPVNEINHLNDLFTLRSLCKMLRTIERLRSYREQNIAWARMKGIENYIKGMEGRGITESEWGIANSGYIMQPINYDTIHGTGPAGYPEEAIDYRQAMADILGPDEYSDLEKRILGKDTDVGIEVIDNPPEPELRAPPEVPFVGDLEGIFIDPIKKAMNILKTSDDECSAAADFWYEMDADGRRIIDDIIQFAEA